MRHALVVVGVSLLALTTASLHTERARACECAPEELADIVSKLNDCLVVFSGLVTDDAANAHGHVTGQPAEFQVERVWKGEAEAVRYITPEFHSCGARFTEGLRYVVFA